MKNNKNYCNYAVILKMPFEEIEELREYLTDRGYYIVFDKYSLRFLVIKETDANPSEAEYDYK